MFYDWSRREVLARGIVERVGVGESVCVHDVNGRPAVRIERECPGHSSAVRLVIDTLTDPNHGVITGIDAIAAVGHRVVHGGDKFAKSVMITPQVLETFKALAALAPLHNPPNISGIEAAQGLMPGIPHVAVMDTAWHQSLMPAQYLYGVPHEWHDKYGVRRYGFHGTSLLYVAKRAAVILGKDPFHCNIITLHVGNGVSANAVRNGLSFDTSMGLTPLEGLVMGTRAGDHDASVGFYMMRIAGFSAGQVEGLLNKKSGLLGITGRFSDRRDILDAANKGDPRAQLAVEIEAYRLKKYIGAYTAALGRVDALVWTAGAGELSNTLRAQVMDGLEPLGILYDPEKNNLARSRNAEFNISAAGSKTQILVIPTDEEIVLVEDVAAVIEGRYDVHTKFEYSFSRSDYRSRLRDMEFARELTERPQMARAIARPFPKA